MSYSLEVGMDFVLKINIVDPPGTITTIELARDISFDITRNEISTNFRGGLEGKWNIKKAGFGEWSASFDIVYDATNDGWKLLRTAFMNRTHLHFRSQDSSEGAGNFFEGDGYVTGFSQGEPLEEFATNSVTFTGSGVPTFSANA